MAKIKKILVTGSSGFIGGAVVNAAMLKGYEIVGLDKKRPVGQDIKFVEGSITDAACVSRAMQDVDAVIHLAAVTSNVEFSKDMKACYDVNVNGFLNVIDAAVKHGCVKFVYASSAAVYPNERNFSEKTVIDIESLKNNYAKTKLINEMIAGSYADEYGIDTVGLRFFNTYGNGENAKGDYASIISQFLRCREKGNRLTIYGDGKQARDFVHVEDVSHITVEMLTRSKYSIYNVGTGKATEYGEIADMIDHEKKEYVKNPLRSYQRLTRADTTRLLDTIGGYRFIDVKEGIAKMAGIHDGT